MAKITGFLEHARKDREYVAVKNRLKNFNEFTKPFEKLNIENVITMPFIFIFYWHMIPYLI